MAYMDNNELMRHIVQRTVTVVVTDQEEENIPIFWGIGGIYKFNGRRVFITAFHLGQKDIKNSIIEPNIHLLLPPEYRTGQMVLQRVSLTYLVELSDVIDDMETDASQGRLGFATPSYLNGFVDLGYCDIDGGVKAYQPSVGEIEEGQCVDIETDLSIKPILGASCHCLWRTCHRDGPSKIRYETTMIKMKCISCSNGFVQFELFDKDYDPERYKGTSGAPIFDSNGSAVAVTSFVWRDRPKLVGVVLNDYQSILRSSL